MVSKAIIEFCRMAKCKRGVGFSPTSWFVRHQGVQNLCLRTPEKIISMIYIFVTKITAFWKANKGVEAKMPKPKLSRVEVRMTPEEKENLKCKADEAHMTVSKYIIHLSQTKRVILKDDIAKLTVEISRIGRNINQIAYIGNYQKFVNRTQLKVVSEYLKQIKICKEKFSEQCSATKIIRLLRLKRKSND